jgi:signal peptidase I
VSPRRCCWSLRPQRSACGRAASDELRSDLDAAIRVQRELSAKDASIAALEGRVEELEAEVGGVRGALDATAKQLTLKEDELAQLTDLVAGSAGAAAQLADLQERYDGLAGAHSELQTEHDALVARWADVVPIESAELIENALYLDRSVSQVAVTRPLCSGSMEPTITCDDLLILYEPQSPTDLDEGDIIYFRKPTPDCTSYLEGRFTLHRISDVISNAQGLWFQTKGDAFVNPDRCLVPADAVQFKLLTTVRNARTDG